MAVFRVHVRVKALLVFIDNNSFRIILHNPKNNIINIYLTPVGPWGPYGCRIAQELEKSRPKDGIFSSWV